MLPGNLIGRASTIGGNTVRNENVRAADFWVTMVLDSAEEGRLLSTNTHFRSYRNLRSVIRAYFYQPACRLVVDINHARRAGIQDMRGTWYCNEEQDSSKADAASDGLSDYILRSHVNFNGDIYLRCGWSELCEEQGTPICE